MTRRSTRAWAAAALTGGALIASTGPANAQLGLPLNTLPPGLIEIVTDLGTTVGGALPAGGGVVTDVTGTVGGIVTGATGTVTGAVDQVLGSATGGLLPGDALDRPPRHARRNPRRGGRRRVEPAAPVGSPAAWSAADRAPAGPTIDARSPNVKFTVLSRLSRIAKTGRIPLDASPPTRPASSPSAAPSAPARRSRRAKKRPARRPPRSRSSSRARCSPIARPARCGSRSSSRAAAQRRLGKVRNARMSLNFVTADVLRNQGKANIKRTVKR